MAPRGNSKKAKAPKTFDDASLSQLTAKIAKKLGGDVDTEKEQRGAPRGNTIKENGGKRKRQDGQPTDGFAKGPKSKKRHTENGRNDGDKGGQQRPAKSAKTPSSTLLEEIKALGGDENDLELIENVDSDAEGDGQQHSKDAEPQVDDKFKSELAKFAASLGLEKLREEVVAEEEEEGEEETEDDDAVSEPGDEAEEVEVEERPLPPPVQQETTKGKKGKLIFEPRPDWYGGSENLPAPVSDETRHLSSAIANLKAYAKTLLDEDAAAYSANQASSSTRKFMSTIMSSGTMSDKVSALTLAIQESPVHNIKAFENLITLAGKKSRGQAIAALGALVDLLGNGVVLPADRRLRTFQTQPGLIGNLQRMDVMSWKSGEKLPRNITKSHLVTWAYEDWLKDAYFRIIQLLEVWCGDEIEYSRSRALDFVFGLLRDKPEQEANLLRLLVNKLGDRDRKIASRASYLLLQLLNVHPGMKAIMIKTVEQEVLLRPGQSTRTKYYAINTLNQTILSMKEPAIADNLLRIYFEMFLLLLKSGSLGNLEALTEGKKQDKGKKGRPKGKPAPADPLGNDPETTQKLVSSILTGVNRAIPFATADDTTLEKHLDTLFRITHSSNFNTSIQALMLIQQLASSKHLAVERFYRTLYESLLDPRLVTSSKQALYLNLLYRSLKNDVDVRRVKAFVKRMLQVINLHQPAFACGILFLVAELQGTFPDLKTLLTEPEYHGEDDEEVYKDVVDDDEPKAESTAPAVDGAEPSKRHYPVYDGRKRDPEYSNADKSCLWELIPFLTHFHPSVSVFAANVLVPQKQLPKPELANHTLMHFLDKFVYRNPKATESKRGGSIMQPMHATGASATIVVPAKAGPTARSSVNNPSFWNLKQEQVAAEDVFFHEYFGQIGRPAQAAKKAKREVDEAGSEDEEAEEEIWEALVHSRPEVGGEDDDDDEDMADLEERYGSDSDEDLDLVDMGSDEEEDGEGGGADLDPDVGDDGFEGIFGDSDEDGEDWEDEDEGGDDEEDEDAGKSKKWKERRERKKELKGLPTFASADDYAEMLSRDDDLDDPNL